MKILFVSLGCDKNSVDSELMLGVLSDAGHTFTDDEEEAEAAIVNTCCFIADAKEESINTVIELGERRKSGQYKALIMTGCLAERYFDEIHKELPEVDAIVTNVSYFSIAKALENVLNGSPKDYRGKLDTPVPGGKKRIIPTPGYSEYLRIAEGCDKRCTYCIIPYIRGPYRSVPLEDLLKEAEDLAKKGVRELNLVAQETTLYGTDLYGKKALPELLRKLSATPGIEWIRLLYCYPEEITEELIETIATEKKVLHYIDMPVQSGSDRILRRMGRKTTREDIFEVVKRLRERIPDICIRTTLITGFPGETKEDHEDTVSLVTQIGFDRLGVFPYSAEEGTPAFSMEDQVPEKERLKRRDEIMRLQQKISLEKGKKLAGTELTVLVEGTIPDEDEIEEVRMHAGRSYMDAPGIDGYVFFRPGHELLSGEFVKVRITDAMEYDLTGEIV